MHIGDEIAYSLRPIDRPTDKDKLWHGIVRQVNLGEDGTVASLLVSSTEPGYEELQETVWPEQIKTQV